MNNIAKIDIETGIVIDDDFYNSGSSKTSMAPRRSKSNSLTKLKNKLTFTTEKPIIEGCYVDRKSLVKNTINCKDRLSQTGLQRKGLHPANRKSKTKINPEVEELLKFTKAIKAYIPLEKSKRSEACPNHVNDDEINSITRSRNNTIDYDVRETMIANTDGQDMLQSVADVQDILECLLSESCEPHESLYLCRKLSSLAITEDIKYEIIFGGGVLAIYDIMSGELISDKELQEIACEIFNAILPYATNEILEDLKLVEVVMELMELYSSSLQMMESCIGILRNLSNRCNHYKHSIVDNDRADIIVSVLKTNQSIKIQKDGWAMLKTCLSGIALAA